MDAIPDEIQVKLDPIEGHPKVLAYVDFRLGPLGVKGTRIEARKGATIVIYPQQPRCGACPECGTQVPLTVAHCGRCGAQQPRCQARPEGVRGWLYKSVCFPVNAEARATLDGAILAAYADARRRKEAPRLSVVA